MSHTTQHEEQARQVKAALPGYLEVRETAAAVLVATGKDIGLRLDERDARDLAEAVVDAIHKGAEVRGIAFACDVADLELAAHERYLLPGARQKAASGDSLARAVLHDLEQYVQGAVKLRNELVERLARVGGEWLASRTARAVVPMPAPKGQHRAGAKVAA
ncbi:hypothetical protein GA0070606_5454 [Micromonospora citrea]|uniref:Uncharacterized protein n=1 Tax=Micromonospora citrea TaxID=47855 RepID=A0A1C6VWX3_9ACTN|nr:hypothetical protein [Micromonospora citrea]SCL70614.1 hypothetical protein GA0070606_5454 [Micromonospora citrea]